MLAAFLVANPEMCRDKSFVELGAGTGLPSVCCSLLGARDCYITERNDTDILENLLEIVAVNGIENKCHVVRKNN